MQPQGFDQDGMLRLTGKAIQASQEVGVMPAQFWAAGLSFSRAQLFAEVSLLLRWTLCIPMVCLSGLSTSSKLQASASVKPSFVLREMFCYFSAQKAACTCREKLRPEGKERQIVDLDNLCLGTLLDDSLLVSCMLHWGKACLLASA